MRYREKRVFHLFVSDKTDYFSAMWRHLQKKLYHMSPNMENQLLESLSIRQSNIHYDILQHQISVNEAPKLKVFDYEEEVKSKKVNMLK